MQGITALVISSWIKYSHMAEKFSHTLSTCAAWNRYVGSKEGRGDIMYIFIKKKAFHTHKKKTWKEFTAWMKTTWHKNTMFLIFNYWIIKIFSPFLDAGKREALADYALVVAVLVMSVIASYFMRDIESKYHYGLKKPETPLQNAARYQEQVITTIINIFFYNRYFYYEHLFSILYKLFFY